MTRRKSTAGEHLGLNLGLLQESAKVITNARLRSIITILPVLTSLIGIGDKLAEGLRVVGIKLDGVSHDQSSFMTATLTHLQLITLPALPFESPGYIISSSPPSLVGMMNG